ncbi:MAG: MFS transporter [Novosphingobium sp.]
MGYTAELRAAWRPILAATIGLGTGMSIVGTVTSAIAPSLIDDAGWSKADFAMVGTLGLATTVAMPFIGRLTDVLGVRLTALIGLVTLPLIYLAYSFIGDSLALYVGIFLVQSVICVTTTSTVYTRLVVQYVRNARGLALAIVASGPAIAGTVGGPVLNAYVEANGWIASFRALALFVAITGVITFLLIPPDRPTTGTGTLVPRRARDDYPLIFRSPAFWLLAGSMLLCNLPQTLMLVQLKLLVLDNGISGEGASVMFSAVSLGMLTGRFITGAALDRFRPYAVSFITLALPSLGLFIIASSFDDPLVILFAIFCLGFLVGAEGDIVAFLVARHFNLSIYSSVMGLLTAITSLSAASGAALLSYTLGRTGGFELFLTICGFSVIAGAFLLLMLGRVRVGEASEAGGHEVAKQTGAQPAAS